VKKKFRGTIIDEIFPKENKMEALNQAVSYKLENSKKRRK
jgi:hypothetical protein